MFATKYYQDKAFVQDLISCKIVFLFAHCHFINLFFMQSCPPFFLVHVVSHHPPDSLCFPTLPHPGIQDTLDSPHLPSHFLLPDPLNFEVI